MPIRLARPGFHGCCDAREPAAARLLVGAAITPAHPAEPAVPGAQRAAAGIGPAGGPAGHGRAPGPRPRGAAELADLLRRLRRPALQPARPDQRGERRPPAAGLELPVRHHRPDAESRDLLL